MSSASRAITWLHISDLHAGIDVGAALWENVRELVLREVESFVSREGPVDLIFFTGDMAQRGNASELSNGLEFLDEIRALASGETRALFFAVPGNHDLVRPRDRFSQVEMLAERIAAGDSEARNHLFVEETIRAQFAQMFSAWTQVISPEIAGYSDTDRSLFPGDFCVEVEVEGTRVGVLGLNTALLHVNDGPSGHADFWKGRLTVDSRQATGAGPQDFAEMKERTDVRFLLTHHPTDWLDRDGQVTLNEEINPSSAGGIRFVHLCGHVHDASDLTLSHGGSASRHQLAGASLFGLEFTGSQQSRIHGLNFGRVDRQREGASRRIFPLTGIKQDNVGWKLIPDHQRWELGSDGWTQPIPLRFSTSSSLEVDSASALPDVHSPDHDLVSIALSGSIVNLQIRDESLLQIKDIMASPVLFTQPLPQVRDLIRGRKRPPVSESAGGQFDEFRITVEQLLEIDDCKCLLITGPRESGLTWTLLYILAMARLDDCEGHYVDCATVPVGITRPFSTITRSERRARMVVAVDNLDSLSPRRRRKFLEDISSVPDSLFLMSVADEGVGVLDTQTLARAGMRARSFYIGPLSLQEIRQLATILLLDLSSARQEEIVDRVMELLLTQQLPRSPYVISILLLLVRDDVDSSEISDVGQLLGKYVDHLLGMEPPLVSRPSSAALDQAARSNLAAWLALDTYRRDQRVLPVSDVERMIDERISGQSQRYSARALVDHLIGAGVLKTMADDVVRFQCESMQLTLAAQFLHRNPEEGAEVLEDLLQNALRHAPLLHIYSALSRGSRRTLTTAVHVLRQARENWLSVYGEPPEMDFSVMSDFEESDRQLEHDLELASRSSDQTEAGAARILESLDSSALIYDHAPFEVRPAADAEEGGLRASLDLASNVLVNSDQLAAEELKLECLNELLRGWSVYLRARDRSIAPLVDELIPSSIELGPGDREQFRRMLSFGALLIYPSTLLSSRRLSTLLDKKMRSSEYKSDPLITHLLIVAASITRYDGWIDALREVLRQSEGSHVRQLIYTMALYAYLGAPLDSRDEAKLLELVLDARSSKASDLSSKFVAGSQRESDRSKLRAAKRQRPSLRFDSA